MDIFEKLECSHGPKDKTRIVRTCHHQRSTIAELCNEDAVLTLACSTCGRVFARFKIEAGQYFCYNDELQTVVPVEDRTVKQSAEPDPQKDGGLPWTRADDERCFAIADYAEGQIRGDA
jgi:hypothetical protein